MAGGVGSRFWPISRQSKPKQFLDILGTGKTFLRSTFERFRPIVEDGNFLIVTNADYKSLVLEQLPELREDQVLSEPLGRNTAPCIAYAAYRINAVDPQADMIVTPADHLVVDGEGFREVINKGVEFIAGKDAMMTIGIKPANPNTGYGYIQVECGNLAPGEICKVKTFTEKPNLEMAKAFVDSGEFLWNSGIFIWNVQTFLRAVGNFLPEVYALFDSIRPFYNTGCEYEHIQKIYPETRAVSVDIGIMEKARNVYVTCGNFGWSDIGTWGSLYEHSERDAFGNAAPPDALLSNTEGCIVKVPEGKIAVIDGLKDYIVVESGNVLMLCPRSKEQDIKLFVENLKFRESEGII